MAAIFAASSGARTLLLERTARRRPQDPHQRRRPLQHSSGAPRRIALRHGFLAASRCGIVRSWPLREQIAFFEHELGLPLVEEVESAKLFPASQRARDVRDGLLALARRARRASCCMDTAVTGLPPDGAGWRVDVDGAPPNRGDAVVVATGGLSVPSTGSDGAGLRIVEGLGHTMQPDLCRAHPASPRSRRRSRACRRIAAGHDHGAFGRSLVDGHGRLSLHAPGLQRSGRARRVARRGASRSANAGESGEGHCALDER